MNRFRIASRFDDRYVGEKCPFCKNAFQDFMELSEELLACFVCGAAFVPKGVKDSEYAGKRAQLERQLVGLTVEEVPEGDKTGFKCTMMGEDGKVCGKVCKNKLGLMAHQRVHGANS